MHVLSGKHRGHAARLEEFAGDRLTADCVTCKTPGIELRPSQVRLTAPEMTRMRESYENFARGAAAMPRSGGTGGSRTAACSRGAGMCPNRGDQLGSRP